MARSKKEENRTIYENVKLLKKNGLSITVKTNLKTTNFLAIYLDLVKGIYQPRKKTNDDHLHININHH